MKQLLFLLLFPCLALAQYQGNANQKITLGEQTSADGLVWRGRTSDTANLLTNKLDTSVYIVLDTGTRAMWYYRASTTPKWTRLVDSLNNLQGQLSLTSKVTGTLPVANGGTNRTTMPDGYILHGDGTSVDTSVNLFWDRTNNRLGIGTESPSDIITVITAASGGNTQALFVSTDSTASTNLIVDVENSAAKRLQVTGFGGSASGTFLGIPRAGNSFVVKAGGKLGIGVDDDYDLLLAAGSYYGVKTMTIEQNGGFKFSTLAGSGSRTVEADLNGVISAPISSITTKENVQTLDYGLNQVLQINPVSFDYIDKNKWGEDRKLGFIVEDIFSVVPEVTGTMNNGDMYLDMVKLIPVLTKAIQEQTIIIKQLEDRILNLENK